MWKRPLSRHNPFGPFKAAPITSAARAVRSKEMIVTNKVLSEIFKQNAVIGDNGETIRIHSGASTEECAFLAACVVAAAPRVTLEVGMACGLSTLAILEALHQVGGEKHYAIDPAQFKDFGEQHAWNGVGVMNVRRAGYADRFELIEKQSELALPEMLARGTRVGFAFIDGWHSFDHALLDWFYVNRMLDVGGIVVFDDASLPSVQHVIRMVVRCPAYRLWGLLPRSRLGRCYGMAKTLSYLPHNLAYVRQDLKISMAGRCVALKKVASDSRSWSWNEFF